MSCSIHRGACSCSEIRQQLSEADALISRGQYAQADAIVKRLVADEGMTHQDLHSSGRVSRESMKKIRNWAHAQKRGVEGLQGVEPFKNLLRFESYMDNGANNPWGEGERHGWKALEKKERVFSDGGGYRKQFSGVWYTIQWSDPVWSSNVYIRPSSLPRAPLDWTRYAEQRKIDDLVAEKVEATVPIEGQTLESLEDIVRDLVKVYKEIAAPIRKLKREATESKRVDSSWDGYTGPEAIQKWQERIEELVVEMLDRHADSYLNLKKYYKDNHILYTFKEALPIIPTEKLIRNIMKEDTGSYEIGYPTGFSGSEASRAFRAVLDSLAKQKKILKEPEQRGWASVKLD
jgi:hypothetical protein